MWVGMGVLVWCVHLLESVGDLVGDSVGDLVGDLVGESVGEVGASVSMM